MIIFLDFAPFEFFGGAEKWIVEMASEVNKKEAVTLISVDPKLASFYSKLVLKRDFTSRVKIDPDSYTNKFSLNWSGLIPFSPGWFKVRKCFKESRLIYFKYELPEFILALYFGASFKKMVPGLHTAFIYKAPSTFFDWLHNFVYQSKISQKVLQSVGKVHVITKKDQDYLKKVFQIKNVYYVPNSIAQKPVVTNLNHSRKNLTAMFIGELTYKKGADILMEVIKNSPKSVYFSIVGDGPFQNEIKALEATNKNCQYYGYLSSEQLKKLYQKADVLFHPSRAEGFPLVFLEALSAGLVILDSELIALDLPTDLEMSVSVNNSKKYLSMLSQLLTLKQKGQLNRAKISSYVQQNFSKDKLYPQFQSQVLGIGV